MLGKNAISNSQIIFERFKMYFHQISQKPCVAGVPAVAGVLAVAGVQTFGQSV